MTELMTSITPGCIVTMKESSLVHRWWWKHGRIGVVIDTDNSDVRGQSALIMLDGFSGWVFTSALEAC